MDIRERVIVEALAKIDSIEYPDFVLGPFQGVATFD